MVRLVYAVLIGTLGAAEVRAQPQTTAAQSAPTTQGTLTGVEGPIISESYTLMPGDQLLVTLTGGITYTYSAWVTYEGKLAIALPMMTGPEERAPGTTIVDAVHISGLNMKTAQDSLAKVFARYIRAPAVKLTLTGLRSGVVFVSGEVEIPGAYYATPVERVSQILAKAGGLTPLGSRTRIKVIRQNREFATVNIELFEGNGDLTANPFVQSGDRIYVPGVTGIVTVKGAVFGRGEYRLRSSALTTEKERISEGIYELNAGERVLDMVRKAGGITPWADLSAAYISRREMNAPGRRTLPVDLGRVLFQSDSEANVLLENDDILVIPPVNTLVYVEGEVVRPGSFLYTPNLKIADYVGMAGGPTQTANMGGIVLIRGGRKTTVRSAQVVEPGDIVFLPRVMLKWWQDYVQVFSAVGLPLALGLLTYLTTTAN